MVCPRCSNTVEDSAAFCPYCGCDLKDLRQSQPVLCAIEETIHSKSFLLYAIFFSIFSGSTLLTIILMSFRNFFSTLPIIAIFICSLISTVGAWRLYAGKNTIEAKNIRLVKVLMTAFYIISILFFVCLCIAIVVTIVGLILSVVQPTNTGVNDVVSQIEQSQNYNPAEHESKINVTFILFICLVIGIFAAIYVAFSIRVYGRSSKFWGDLANAVQTGSYHAAPPPTIFLFIWGILNGLGVTSPLLASFFPMVIAYGAMAGILFVQGLLFYKIHNKISKTLKQAIQAGISTQ